MSKAGKLKFYTRDEFAEIFAISVKTVDRWIAKGTISPVVKVHRTVRIPHGALAKLAEAKWVYEPETRTFLKPEKF